jgi:hemophore-related protein
MIKLSLTKLSLAIGVSALSLGVGSGVASAAPDLTPAINTTCSYPQFMSALNARNPQAQGAFDSSPVLRNGLSEFLASGPERRREIAQYVAASAMFAPYLGTIEQAFNTCNGF